MEDSTEGKAVPPRGGHIHQPHTWVAGGHPPSPHLQGLAASHSHFSNPFYKGRLKLSTPVVGGLYSTRIATLLSPLSAPYACHLVLLQSRHGKPPSFAL